MGGRRLAVVCAIRFVKRLPVLVILFSAIIFCYWTVSYNKNHLDQDGVKAKKILIWSTRKHIDLEILFTPQPPGIMDQCHFDCLLSEERTLSALHQSDAVVFNMPPMTFGEFPIDPNRRREQRYVFFSPEPPMLFADDMKKFNHLFNWTMSYRQDSDIVYSYGDLIPREKGMVVINQPGENQKKKKKKTKLVAWFVSHCLTPSRREAYFERLRDYIAIDVYGDCYNNSLKCWYDEETHLSGDHCYDMLERDYKFYLAFENSLCTDYVTEKFFKILQRRIVPIVIGGADYSKFAPPNSYIDANKFSPRKLAEYLQKLDTDEELYNKFFDWKDELSVTSRYPAVAARTLCDLCAKLHNTSEAESVYDNLASLWSISTQCRKPKFKGLPLVFGVF